MYSSTLEPNWSVKGGGVVDISSQIGMGWNDVNVQPTIFGSGVGKELAFDDAQNFSHPYHHSNTRPTGSVTVILAARRKYRSSYPLWKTERAT